VSAPGGERRRRAAALVVGAAFGFLLTGSGLGDYHTIHDGLLLRDPYIYLMMAATVATAAAGIALLRRRGRTLFGEPVHIPRHPVRRSAVYGGAVFGVGFGIGATCPGITVAGLATGSLYGLVVLAGILLGLWLRGYVEERSAPTPRPRSRRRSRAGRSRAQASSPGTGERWEGLRSPFEPSALVRRTADRHHAVRVVRRLGGPEPSEPLR
jgi:hypothetical protein